MKIKISMSQKSVSSSFTKDEKYNALKKTLATSLKIMKAQGLHDSVVHVTDELTDHELRNIAKDPDTVFTIKNGLCTSIDGEGADSLRDLELPDDVQREVEQSGFGDVGNETTMYSLVFFCTLDEN